MYKQVITPDKENHSIKLPENLYGKKVEITIKVIEENDAGSTLLKTKGSFLDDIEVIPDFPSIEEIRKGSWPDNDLAS